MMAWVVEHSGWLLRRCLVGEDGRTAYERIKGKKSVRPIVKIGEEVWYTVLKPKEKKTNMEHRVEEGIFLTVLGRSGEAGEAIFGKSGARPTRRSVPLARLRDTADGLALQVRIPPRTKLEGVRHRTQDA